MINEKPDYEAIQKRIKEADIKDENIRNIDGTLSAEKIKHLLLEATPGPWKKSEPDRWGVISGIYDKNNIGIIEGTDDAFGISWEDANLIALAPTIIKELLEKIEQLEKDLELAKS